MQYTVYIAQYALTKQYSIFQSEHSPSYIKSVEKFTGFRTFLCHTLL